MVSRQVKLLPSPTWKPWSDVTGAGTQKLIIAIFFCHHPLGGRNAMLAFHHRNIDPLWALDIGFLGKEQVILIRFFPFHQEHKLSLESIAPIICSSSKPWAKPHGSSDSSFFFDLFSPLFSESVNFPVFLLSHMPFSMTVETQQWCQGSPGSLLDPVCCPHLRIPSTLGGTPLCVFHSMFGKFLNHISFLILL